MNTEKHNRSREASPTKELVGVVVPRLVRRLLLAGEAGTFMLNELKQVGPYGAYSAEVAFLDRSRYGKGHGQTPSQAVSAAVGNLPPNV